MYRIHYSISSPTSPDRSLTAALGDFDSVDEARKLARWVLDTYGGSQVEIREIGSSFDDPRVVEIITP